MKYVIYIRESTDEQKLGASAQIEACLSYIRKQNPNAEYVIFQDSGVSGKTGITTKKRDGTVLRAGLISAIDALKKDDVFLVLRRDRIGRDVTVNGIIEHEITRKKATLICVLQDDSDLDTGTRMLLRTIMDAIAQYERYLISQRTSAALQIKKSKRERVGGVPYGWELLPDGKTLAPCAKEQETLGKLRDLRAQGLPYRSIATKAREIGIVNRNNKPFAHQAIALMLENQNPGCISADSTPKAQESFEFLECE